MTDLQSTASALPAVELYSDGACLGNPGPGGWAYILRHKATGKEKVDSGGEGHTTNNRMEITAVIRGLEALKTRSEVHLCSDSQYVLNGIRDWLPQWKKRGWRTAAKKPVLNVDLWTHLDELLQQHDIRVEWVRGHAGHDENERCDQMASAAARQMADAPR